MPKLDILAVDADEDPHEVKNAREKETKYLRDMEVYECPTEAEARVRTGRNPVGFKWIDTNKGSADSSLCACVSQHV